MNATQPFIARLAPDEIFVFGSNEAGRHGAGAARTAMLRFGAEWGKGVGRTGLCYAIPTKDRQIRTLPLDEIAIYVGGFVAHATANRKLKFLVTAIGCGLAGYTPAQIAPLFFAHAIPDNVWLPAEFLAERK